MLKQRYDAYIGVGNKKTTWYNKLSKNRGDCLSTTHDLKVMGL